MLGGTLSAFAFYWAVRMVRAELQSELWQIKRRYACNRGELWEMWRRHVEVAERYVYVTTVSAGSPGSESHLERPNRDAYYRSIQRKLTPTDGNHQIAIQHLWQCSWESQQMLETEHYDKVNALIEREHIGFKVRVKLSPIHPFLRYQIVDGKVMLLNIPERHAGSNGQLLWAPSERCVAIDEQHFVQHYVDEFRKQWEEAVTLSRFIETRIVLPLCSENEASEKTVSDIVIRTGLPDKIVLEAVQSLRAEGRLPLIV